MASIENQIALTRFWKWFVDNQHVLVKEFCDIEKKGGGEPAVETFDQVEQVLGQMMDELHKYDDRLFPFCGLTPDGGIELIITAEGNVDAFGAAHALVKQAPDLEDWNIMALKPRVEGSQDGFEIRSLDGEVGLESLQFSIVPVNGETLLMLAFDIEGDEVEEELAYMGVSLVESLLGEQDLATGFDAINVSTVREYLESGPDIDLSDISDLPAEFDKRRLH